MSLYLNNEIEIGKLYKVFDFVGGNNYTVLVLSECISNVHYMKMYRCLDLRDLKTLIIDPVVFLEKVE